VALERLRGRPCGCLQLALASCEAARTPFAHQTDRYFQMSPGQAQLTVSSASLPPANCTKSSAPATWLTGRHGLVTARRALGIRLGAVGGCVRPFEPPPRVVRLETPAGNGWLPLVFSHLPLSRRQISGHSGERASVTGFCGQPCQRVPSPVLLPPVVQSKLGGMLGGDHANLPPTSNHRWGE
jgi:hypothetical protein